MSQSILDSLKDLGAFAPVVPQSILDAAEKKANDANADAASAYVDQSIRDGVASSISVWLETTDLDEGETYSDRLLALLGGIADQDGSGELDEDEQAILDIAAQAAFDLLVKLGATEEDASAMLEDGSEEAGDRVFELLQSEGFDDEALDSFVFDAESAEPVLDAVYKKKLVVRKGKKIRINKRISGTVHRSAAQKVAIRKASMKSHTATARMHRLKSMKVRARLGLNK